MAAPKSMAAVTVAMVVFACGDGSSGGPPVEPSASVEPEQPPPLDEREDDEAKAEVSDDPPLTPEEEIRQRLEVECFQGVQAACDELGH
ncbi:MAG: hypothetical protein AAGF12_20430 [Myxococcota bacterium]